MLQYRRMRGRVVASKYELERLVGQGGMGAVWQARDRVLERAVAIKLMGPEQLESADAQRRFHREALSLAQLRNDHIVQIFDYGIDEDTPYIVMELLEGEDLEQRLKRDKILDPPLVATLLRQAADGLIAAASKDVVHRDLKPANLFLTTRKGAPVVKLLDFGVAWVQPLQGVSAQSMGEKLIGTPLYMSPEQIRGRTPSHLGDLWSLAVIAYRALTGVLPFQASQFGELLVSICTDPFRMPSSINPKLPASFDEFFARALHKDPLRRFQTASEFVEALARACLDTSTLTILAVDDEPDMARLLKGRYRKQIRSSTYRFLFAEDGAEALEQLRRNPEIDVILSDINMPKMDGLTLLEQIPGVTPFARTIMVTAYGDMKNLRRAMNAGAFDFVVKPIDFKDLDATMQKALRTVAEHRAMASSDRENQLLRKLASSIVVRRLSNVGVDLALATEKIEATVVKVRVVHPIPGVDNAASYVRALNANYEVIIPEIQRQGGAVDSIIGAELVCVWTGQQLHRALDACVAMTRELQRLAALAGEASPYACGLAVGVATGHALSSCLGSQVCNRFNYTLLGNVADEASELARVARPGEVLTTEGVSSRAASTHRFAGCEHHEMLSEARPAPIMRLLCEADEDEESERSHGMTLTSSSMMTQTTMIQRKGSSHEARLREVSDSTS